MDSAGLIRLLLGAGLALSRTASVGWGCFRRCSGRVRVWIPAGLIRLLLGAGLALRPDRPQLRSEIASAGAPVSPGCGFGEG